MNNNNKKPIDYYDRIADALERISGDDSHIDDEYKNMDYYDRIADALETIVENGEVLDGTSIKGLNINQNTNIISLKGKNNEIIDNSEATLPTYGITFDSTTGGLTLTKNGTAMSGQTVTIPNYGSPVGVTDSANMVDEGVIYLYEGITGGGFTNGHFYYYDGTTWADGGEYAAATVQTDKTLLVEDRAADAKATGETVGKLKIQLDDISEPLNYYNPNIEYDNRKSDGSVINYGVTVNNDGSVSYTRYANQSGQILLKSKDSSNILKAGTYTLSARVTIDDGITLPSVFYEFQTRVGFQSSVFTTNMKTERGGNVNAEGRTGWVSATFTLAEDEVFAFEVMPKRAVADDDHPVIVDYIMINAGEHLADYSTSHYAVKGLSEVQDDLTEVQADMSEVKEDVEDLNSKIGNIFISTFISGNTGANGRISESTNKCTTGEQYTLSEGDTIRVINLDTGIKFGIGGTNGSSYVYNSGWKTADFSYTVESGKGGRYFVNFSKTNESSDLSPSEIVTTKVIINNSNYLTEYAQEDEVNWKDSRGFAYTSRGVMISWAENSGGGMTVTIPTNSFVARLYSQNKSIIWGEHIPSGDEAQYFSVDAETGYLTVTLPSYSRVFVYNTEDDLLHIRNQSSRSNAAYNPNDLVLFSCAYGTPSGGLLYEETINRKVLTYPDGLTETSLRANTFNTAYHTGATDFAVKCTEFSSLLYGEVASGATPVDAPVDFEAFLFFTDPHLTEFSGWENRCYEMIAQIQKYYNSTPTTFCLCGGDWLGNSDLPSTACYKMGYIDGFMHSMFDNCYMIVGNHDTNYQGKKDSESEKFTTRLSNQSIIDLWYRNGKKAYYTFDGANTRFYCFDTGIEAQLLTDFNNYGYEQAQWFATALLTDNSPHIAIAAHMLIKDNHGNYNSIADQVLQIAQAYNNRGSITVNGTEYSFASVTGKVEFMIAGHTHDDQNGVLYGIPWALSANVRNDESKGATFDLVFADYDNAQLKMIRVGNGANRTISLT